MNAVTTDDFAVAFGIKLRAAQCALASAAQGKTWRGYTLPGLYCANLLRGFML